MSPARSIVAVVAGFAVATLCVMIGQGLSRFVATPPDPANLKSIPPGFLAFNLACALAAGEFGGFVAASIGRVKPVAHGIGLAAVIAILSLSSLGSPQARLLPTWYLPAVAACGVAGAVSGSMVRLVVAKRLARVV